MKYYYIILLCCLILGSCATATAQANRDSIWIKTVASMQKNMGLSPQTASQVIKAGREENARFDSLNKDRSLSVEQRGQALRRSQKTFFDRMRSILSVGQWRQYQQMLASRRDSYLEGRKDKKIHLNQLEQD